MRTLFAALLTAALVGCGADNWTESVSESSSMNADGTESHVRIETKTRKGVTTGRKTETIVKGGVTTKTVYEKKGDEWVKVE